MEILGDEDKAILFKADHVICTGNCLYSETYRMSCSLISIVLICLIFICQQNAHWIPFIVPLGFLKENHKKLFNPSLPMETQNSIREINFGVVCKIFLEFERPLTKVSLEMEVNLIRWNFGGAISRLHKNSSNMVHKDISLSRSLIFNYNSLWVSQVTCNFNVYISCIYQDLSGGFCLLWPKTVVIDEWFENGGDPELTLFDRTNWYRQLFIFHKVVTQPTMLQGNDFYANLL